MPWVALAKSVLAECFFVTVITDRFMSLFVAENQTNKG